MISEDDYKKILSSLQTLCARREYCPSEIRQKALSRIKAHLQDEEDRQDAGDLADRMTESLIGDSYVDSLRYAKAFASEKSSLLGWGPYKISQALCTKQIDRQTIEEALESLDAERAESKLEKLLRNKWKSLQDDPQGRFKLLRYALSRGYEYDSSLRSLLERIENGQEEVEEED